MSAPVPTPPVWSPFYIAMNGGVPAAGELLTSMLSAVLAPVASEPPEWVELLPAGEIAGVDGRRWRMGDVGPVLELSRELARATGGDLPIDFDHQIDRTAQNGAGAPAAGWIKELQAREGGTIWGRVEWTERGDRAIRSREYRFVSPVFAHARDGEVKALLRAGLTNAPNLALTALASREDAAPPPTTEVPMAQEKKAPDGAALLASVAKLLGLPETSDEPAVLARCSQVVASETELRARVGKVAGALQLDAAASDEQLVTAINARGGAPDPTQWVPMAVHRQTQDALRALQASTATSDVETAVNDAVKAGKVTPASRGWAVSYASRDLAGFREFVKNAPVIVEPNGSDPGTQDAGDAGGKAGVRGLDTDDLAVCTRLGLDPEKYKSNLQR